MLLQCCLRAQRVVLVVATGITFWTIDTDFLYCNFTSGKTRMLAQVKMPDRVRMQRALGQICSHLIRINTRSALRTKKFRGADATRSSDCNCYSVEVVQHD